MEGEPITALSLAKPRRLRYETGAGQSRNPWRIVDEVDLVTAEWVSWFNTAGFTSTADIPPIELEAAEYAHHQNQPRAETPHLLVCTVQPEVWLGGRSDRAARGGISQVPSMAGHTEHRRETRPGHR